LAELYARFVTSEGPFTVRLFEQEAPNTVANFVGLAEGTKEWTDPRTRQKVMQPYYDGIVFHRVIDGFMIQGGGFEPGMKQKPTRAPVKNEADNMLKNDAYTVAMARTPDPHSATAQFFINVSDNRFLNFTAPTAEGWGYCVFGHVTEGTEVVDKIRKVKTGNPGMHQDVPVDDVVIQKAEVVG
jgi:peptidyl-prolyl cis-trans isomerase B (cyclophilin B)